MISSSFRVLVFWLNPTGFHIHVNQIYTQAPKLLKKSRGWKNGQPGIHISPHGNMY